MLDNESLGNESNLPVGHQEFESLLANCGAAFHNSHLAIGVSGGADSMASVSYTHLKLPTKA